VEPSPSTTSTPRQADVSASATNTPKQVDPSASATPKQVDPSASATPKQVDPSASASATPKQVDPSATASATQKPSPSAKPSVYPRQTFSLLFQNANNTLIRSSPKLQQLQSILACVVQTPLENIDITTVAVGSTSVPFTKPQGAGAPNCTATAARILYSQRRLQATAVDTTVSFDLLNAPYVSQTTFQTDPMILSFGSSVGSSGQIVAGSGSGSGSSPAPTNIGNAGAIVGGFLGAICAVGIVGFGIMYVRSQRIRRPVSRTESLPKTQARINPLVSSNNRISYSPAVVKMSRSNSV
jgi:hypothetical protein